MRRGSLCFRLGCSLAAAASWASATAPRAASAQPAPVPCDRWDVEYVLAGSLELSETPLGQGDGIYPVGPGHLVVRFEDRGGQPGGRAKIVSYDMRQAFTVVAKTLFWRTSVVNDSMTRALVDRDGPPEGMLSANAVTWTGSVAFRTEGTLTCDGSFCGKFGAPPPGRSPLQIGPSPVRFLPFEFSRDMKTFTMRSTFVSKTESPKQTGHLAFSGREISRACRGPSAP